MTHVEWRENYRQQEALDDAEHIEQWFRNFRELLAQVGLRDTVHAKGMILRSTDLTSWLRHHHCDRE